MLEYVQNKEVEVIADPRERFLVKLYDMQQAMGFWYSIAALRIVPILLYIIPLNIIAVRANRFLGRYNPDLASSGTFLVTVWVLLMIALAAVAIISPKAATVVEFVFGFAYLFFAFKDHLFNTVLGYILLISMIIFLLTKAVFLVFKIMRMRLSAGDAENVERDESGRIIQSSKEDVFFDKTGAARDETVVKSADNEFFLVNENSAVQDEQTARVADDDFFIGNVADAQPEPKRSVSDDDFFIGNADAAQPEPKRSVSDDDFFIGNADAAQPEQRPVAADDDFFFVKHNPNDDRVSKTDDDFFFG